jgi:hypothetical protein
MAYPKFEMETLGNLLNWPINLKPGDTMNKISDGTQSRVAGN